MRDTVAIIILLFFLCSIIKAQSENKIPSKTNSVMVANTSQSTDYSESIPYKPREFKVKQELKPKSKSKKDAGKENQTVAPVDAPPRETNENTVIAENSLLTIPISVLEANGNPVQNLKKSDFKIYIDGQEQEIADFGTYDQPLNLILILDTSPSTYYEIEEIEKYAMTVVKQLRPQDKVMVIKFDERAKILVDLTDDRQQANKALKKLSFGDGTSLYETVKDSLQNRISQINGRKLVLLLTDGVDTTSKKATFEDSLLEAEKNDALFFPVYLDTYQYLIKPGNGRIISGGRTSSINRSMQQILSQVVIPTNQNSAVNFEEEYERGRQYLADLALLSGGRAVAIQNLKNLNKDGFGNVFETFRNQYYINVNFSGSGKIGQRRQIRVRVNRPNLSVKARGSYIIAESEQTLPVDSK